MGNPEETLVPRHAGKRNLRARRLVVVEAPVAQDAGSRGIVRADRMLARDDEAIVLIQVHGARYVGRNERVVSPHAVDLNRQVYRDVQRVELASEPEYGRSSETLAIDDEPNRLVGSCERIAKESDGNVTPLVLEGFRIDLALWIAQFQRELPNAFGVVVPSVASAEKPNDEAGALGDGLWRPDVGEGDPRTRGQKRERGRREVHPPCHRRFSLDSRARREHGDGLARKPTLPHQGQDRQLAEAVHRTPPAS